MSEYEYLPEVGERQPQGIPSIETWIMDVIQHKQQKLGAGERIDPWFVSDALQTFQDQVVTKMAQARGSTIGTTIETETPHEEAFLYSIHRLRDALDIIAYPFYNVGQQKMISEQVHTYHWKSQQPFTLNGKAKATLQKITTTIGIPDDPQQLTYSFASIPAVPKFVTGSIKG